MPSNEIISNIFNKLLLNFKMRLWLSESKSHQSVAELTVTIPIT